MAEGGSLPSGGTSRKNREVYTRFCERLRVKFRGPNRRMRVHSINPPSPRRNEQLPNGLRSNGGQPARSPHEPDNSHFLLLFRFFDRTRS
jgi:hypothetical protein